MNKYFQSSKFEVDQKYHPLPYCRLVYLKCEHQEKKVSDGNLLRWDFLGCASYGSIVLGFVIFSFLISQTTCTNERWTSVFGFSVMGTRVMKYGIIFQPRFSRFGRALLLSLGEFLWLGGGKFGWVQETRGSLLVGSVKWYRWHRFFNHQSGLLNRWSQPLSWGWKWYRKIRNNQCLEKMICFQ